jgi:transcriptional regulator with XRE-family HTH domain
MHIPKAFGPMLREARQARGLTAKQLGDAVGLSTSFILGCERGETTPPSLTKIYRLADELQINRDSLAAAAGKMSRQKLAHLWSTALSSGLLSSATGLSQSDAERFVAVRLEVLQTADDEAAR